MNGVKSGASLSFWGSGTSQDDALAYLSKTEVRASSKFAEGIGGVVGGALTGGAGSMAVVGAVNGIATVFGGKRYPNSNQIFRKNWTWFYFSNGCCWPWLFYCQNEPRR
ncbi:MAG: hypothetical protein L6V95_05245 [Candidatus Melainabacteria bacterium]|nr:MAG: hypothetical protein L6V95_05245 [Candidatus Melainabacteria bacterium]